MAEIHLLLIHFDGAGNRVVGGFTDKARAEREAEALNGKQPGWAGVRYYVDTMPVVVGDEPLKPWKYFG